MTIPILRVIKEQSCQKVDPADMTTYREVVTRDLLPSNGTDERAQVQRFCDRNGRLISPDSVIHICPICQGVVHLCDTFDCVLCHLNVCKTHADELVELPPPPRRQPQQKPTDEPQPAPVPQAPPQSIGVCKPCARKAFWKTLLLFPISFFIRPLHAIFTENGSDQPSPQNPPRNAN
jgi:hypothetical protein